MLSQKINSLIQFALASRAIVYKQTLFIEAKKNKIHLIIIASDIKETTKHDFSSLFIKIPTISYLSKNELGSLINKEEIAIIGIRDINLAKGIISEYKQISENEINKGDDYEK